jgi:transposase
MDEAAFAARLRREPSRVSCQQVPMRCRDRNANDRHDRRRGSRVGRCARAVIAFQTMIRTKAGDELDGWIDRAKTGLLASLANGVMKDRAAIAAAFVTT